MVAPLMTLSEVAKVLRVSERTVRQYARERVIGSVRIGKLYRFTAAQVEEFQRRASTSPLRSLRAA